MLRSSGFTYKRGLAALLIAAGVTGCSSDQTPPAKPTPEVGVYMVNTQPYTVTETLPGRTRAYMSSEVRPQIDGIIEKRLFTEGADVKAGQVLYQIDPARYQAAYDSAKAALAQAKAAVESARPLAQRYTALAKIDAISKQDRDNAVASLAQDRANVATARAKLESARINRDYTRIEAPIGGRIGASTYTPGALVTANQTQAMATINQLDPIYVDIQQSVGQYLTLKQAIDSGKLDTDNNDAAPVRVTPEGGHTTLDGKLEFSGVSVNQDTGSVMLRAIVANPKHTLLPGMFVRATLTQGIDMKAILVPQQAVSRDASGQPTALVVGADHQVRQRKLEVASAAGDNRWRVSSGLKAGDRVIVQGTDKVKIGQKVDTTLVTIDADGTVHKTSARTSSAANPANAS